MSITLTGAILGYGLFSITKPYYNSSMTLILAEIRNEFIEDQLNKLSVLINEQNFGAISERLDISVEAAGEIKGMSFYNLDQDRIAEDSVLTGSPFRIELMLYNNQLFDTMEPALTNYLENNRYFSKQKRIRQQQMQSMISKYKQDIESLDSVKTTVASPQGPVNGFVYGQPIDPSNLYRESINMYQEQIELEAELEQLDNVEVVNGFVTRLRPSGPNLIKYVLVGASIGFLVGLLVALRLESNKRKLQST
ncbi:YveK family protein [Pontibacter russatus]|uniref:chain length determinant protein n=1 Tax=Pontibacter russatus TaxID=2694929 RepID=UPI001F2EA922|nr:chain length determinant protein [Pontibacter russatus]